MSPARWDRGPAKSAERAKPRPAARGAWRCCGVQGCGEILTGTYKAAERHADTHGGARLEIVGPDSQAS